MNLTGEGLFIDGQFVQGKGTCFDVICPANGKVYFSTQGADEAQTNEALEAARRAFKTWSKTTLNERAGWITKLCNAMEAHRADFVEAVTHEMGKAYGEAGNDLDICLNSMKFFMEQGKRVYETGVTDWNKPLGKSYNVMIRRPVGVVVAHLAWNWPIQNMGIKLGPILISGCTCVLKPSQKSPVTALLLAEILKEIDFPAGVINVVTGPSAVVGKTLNESRIPRLITLIGASETGRQVMRQGTTSVKRYSMELGGNAPAIVMPDADLKMAAKLIAGRKIRGCGQSCSSMNRIYVHKDVHDEFIQYLTQEVAAYESGWGPDKPAAIGPMIDIPTRDEKIALIEEAVAGGAKVLVGGGIPEGLPEEFKDGAFLAPTLIDGATEDMRLCKEESFCPVLPVMTFETFDEVIERANNTEYGLASFLFTYDARIIARALEELEFGEVCVNETARGPWLPHIGIKESGIGCDQSKWALDEYYETRRFTVTV